MHTKYLRGENLPNRANRHATTLSSPWDRLGEARVIEYLRGHRCLGTLKRHHGLLDRVVLSLKPLID